MGGIQILRNIERAELGPVTFLDHFPTETALCSACLCSNALCSAGLYSVYNNSLQFFFALILQRTSPVWDRFSSFLGVDNSHMRSVRALYFQCVVSVCRQTNVTYQSPLTTASYIHTQEFLALLLISFNLLCSILYYFCSAQQSLTFFLLLKKVFFLSGRQVR